MATCYPLPPPPRPCALPVYRNGQIMASRHQHHWHNGERVMTSNNDDNDGRHPHPNHNIGSRYQLPNASGRWPPPAVPMGPIESPVRVRRSAVANEEKKFDAGGDVSVPTAGVIGSGAGGLRGGGRGEGGAARGGWAGGDVLPMHHQQQDQQMNMNMWEKKPVALHDVEHRSVAVHACVTVFFLFGLILSVV